ncbi:hypothetical protein G9A89_000949 [Geosiphon pyriformis]|nr:hypothetical protein G9A89_000949 [Geosiphon pyriformis]
MNFENQPYQRSNSIGQPICHDNRHSYQQQLYQNQFVRNECHVEPSQITFFNKQNQNFAHDNVNDANSSLNQTKDYVNAFTLTHPGSSEIRQLSNSQSEMPPSFNSDSHLKSGTTSRKTAGFRTYAMKTLHGLLPVAERKKVYSSEVGFTSLMYPDLVECADLVMDLYANLVKGFVFKEWIVDSSSTKSGVEGLIRMFINLHRVKIWKPSVEIRSHIEVFVEPKIRLDLVVRL